jgi:hypothetical protein
VADGNRTTLIVAVAGIAATALVGLAGTGAAWLSARNDRAAQGEIARDERTYDRRVSAYLDAIDFIAGQERSFALVVVYKATGSQEEDPVEDPVISRLQSDLFLETTGEQEFIPVRLRPPSRLTSRLGAFGSTEAFNAFQEGQRRFRRIPFAVIQEGPGRQKLAASQIRLDERFIERFKAFSAQVGRFRGVVHEEIG